MKAILTELFLITTLFGCDYEDNRLVITNSSTKPVAVAFSNDTTELIMNPAEYYILTALNPNETRHFSKPGSPDVWLYYVRTSNFKKLSIYFYDIDTLKKYLNMDYINQNKLFIDKIDYSEEELNKINWMIKYP